MWYELTPSIRIGNLGVQSTINNEHAKTKQKILPPMFFIQNSLSLVATEKPRDRLISQ